MKLVIFLLILIGSSAWCQLPESVKDKSVHENEEFLLQEIKKNTKVDANNCIDDPTFCVNATNNEVTVTTLTATNSYGSYRYRSVQTFSTSGAFTWTKPAGINYIHVQLIGGGGSGGGAGAGVWNAGGGGAGGLCEHWYIVLTATPSFSGTVGAGGAQVAANTIGNDGASTTFGPLTSGGGTGGSRGGLQNAYGGPGGTVSGCNINISGSAGMNGSDAGGRGGMGGNSHLGGAGRGASNQQGQGSVGTSGSGGGGGAAAAAGELGQAGGAGIVVVEEYQ